MADPAPAPPPETVEMFTPEGEAVQLAPEQARQAFASGAAGFREDQQVFVRGDNGQIRAMSGADAAKALGSYQNEVVSGGAFQAQEKAKEFDTVGAKAGAVLAGAGSALSFGGTDWLAAKVGGEGARQYLADQQQQLPGWRMGGEALGILGATVASGGLGGARGLLAGGARAVSAPVRGAMALGRGAEALTLGAGRAVGLAEEGWALRALASGAGAATEGALFGVGQAVSQSSIKNTDLTAERVLAAMGHGALLGGVLGGGGSLLGSLARGAVSKAGDVGAGLLGRVERRGADLGGELAAGVTPKADRTLASMASDFSREQALKASGATQGQIARLRASGPDLEARAVKRLLDDVPEAVGQKAGSILSAEQKALGAARLVESDGAKIGTLIDDLGAAGVKADVAKLASKMREKITGETLGAVSPDATRAAKQVDEWLSSLESKLGSEGEIKALWQARKELRKDIDWKKAADSGDRANEWKKDLYRSMGEEIEGAGLRATDKIGPEFAARWADANKSYRASLWLQEATAKGAAANAKNRVFGLSEQLGVLGGVGASVIGGGGLLAAPLAIGGAAVSHLVRKYGSDVAANVARAATHGEAVVALDRAVASMTGERVAGLISGGKRALGVARGGATGIASIVDRAVRREAPAEPRKGGLPSQYKAARKELLDGLATRDARLAAATAGLDRAAPGLGAAVREKTMRAGDFLAMKLPQVAQRASLQPHLERERLPSAQEMQKFLRYERAVQDPLSVLDDARAGRLRREGVEALQAVYPSMYGELQAEVGAALAEKSTRLSYGERVQISMLLDLPGDPSLEPAAIRALQAIQQAVPSPLQPLPPPGQSAGASPPPVGRPLRLPSLATKGDRFAAGV